MSRPIVRAKGVHKSYGIGHAEVKVLRGASLEIEEGEFLVIMGASGSGKSTFLHMLGALDIPDRGRVEFRGESVFDWPRRTQGVYRNRDVGFIFQFYHLLPELNVLENVMTPRMVSTPLVGWRSRRSSVRKDATEVLDRVGLADRLKHRPNQLSGGEKQRVAIARALINRPALLLADEPTGNLDAASGAEILKLLVEFGGAGQTIVMVTHDANVASRAHRRVHLSEGVLRETSAAQGGRETGGSVKTRAVL